MFLSKNAYNLNNKCKEKQNEKNQKILPGSELFNIEVHQNENGSSGYCKIPVEFFYNKKKNPFSQDVVVEYIKASVQVDFEQKGHNKEVARVLAEEIYDILKYVNLDTFINGKEKILQSLLSSDRYSCFVKGKIDIEEASEAVIDKALTHMEDKDVDVKEEKRDVLKNPDEKAIDNALLEKISSLILAEFVAMKKDEEFKEQLANVEAMFIDF